MSRDKNYFNNMKSYGDFQEKKDKELKEFYAEIGYIYEHFRFGISEYCYKCEQRFSHYGDRGIKKLFSIDRKEFICQTCAEELHTIYTATRKRYEQLFKNRLQITDEELSLLRQEVIRKVGEF